MVLEVIRYYLKVGCDKLMMNVAKLRVTAKINKTESLISDLELEKKNKSKRRQKRRKTETKNRWDK